MNGVANVIKLMMVMIFICFQTYGGERSRTATSSPGTMVAVDVLAGLLKSETFGIREEARKQILALELRGLPLLEALAGRLTSQAGQGTLDEICRDMRTLILNRAVKDSKALVAAFKGVRLSGGIQNKLGLQTSMQAGFFIWFPCQTLKDHNRLRSLEFLVMPENSYRGYECFA